MPRAGIYTRLSEEDRDKVGSEESESIQNQRSMLIKFCVDRGWNIYDIYCDEDYSGADSERPDWKRLIKDCSEGCIDVVVCKTQSRFSRDMEMIEHYIHGKFVEWGIRFIGVVDNADTEVEGNKKSRQINGLINEWYLEDLSKNIRDTLRHKKQRGEWTGSFAPYGYLIDPKDKNRIIVDPVASEYVREVFELFASGLGYVRIAKLMNERGVLSPTLYKRSIGLRYRTNERYKTSQMWTDSTIYYMLRQEMYLGTMVQGKSHNVSYKSKKRVSNDKSTWIRKPGTHEAIISKELWDAVHSRLRSKTRTSFDGTDCSMRHVLSGKVFCASCGNTMYKLSSQSSGKRFNYLRCKTYKNDATACDNSKFVRLDLVVDFILKEINTLLDRYYEPSMIETPQETAAVSRESALRNELALVTKELDQATSSSLRLYEDRLSGLVSEEQFRLMNSKIRDRIDTFAKRQAGISRELDMLTNSRVGEDYRDRLLSQYRQLDTLTHEVVNQFINAIYIHPRKEDGTQVIEVKWNF